MVISVPDQKMAIVREGARVADYQVSTSKFGLGDTFSSYRTPTGVMTVCEKLGGALPVGAVIKHRCPTGEIIPPNAPGRDPIVTRVIRLRGLEMRNRNAYAREIYIHGTPQESCIGKQVSWGCIRMRSRDVIALYNRISVGVRVVVTEKRLAEALPRPVDTTRNLLASAR